MQRSSDSHIPAPLFLISVISVDQWSDLSPVFLRASAVKIPDPSNPFYPW
jgi:hypothetical protein